MREWISQPSSPAKETRISSTSAPPIGRPLPGQPGLRQVGLASPPPGSRAPSGPVRICSRPAVGFLDQRQARGKMLQQPFPVMRLRRGGGDQQHLVLGHPRHRHLGDDPALVVGEIAQPQPPDCRHLAGDLPRRASPPPPAPSTRKREKPGRSRMPAASRTATHSSRTAPNHGPSRAQVCVRLLATCRRRAARTTAPAPSRYRAP